MVMAISRVHDVRSARGAVLTLCACAIEVELKVEVQFFR